MLKFTKKKTDPQGVETGDFYGFDASVLYDELKPLNARCDTAEVEITVYPIDPDGAWDEKAIREVVLLHGSQEQVDARAKAKERVEVNAPILKALTENDLKRVRAMCEGDTDWIDKYNKIAIELRSKLI